MVQVLFFLFIVYHYKQPYIWVIPFLDGKKDRRSSRIKSQSL